MTRPNPHSAEPWCDSCEMDECEEVIGSSVISCGEASEVFRPVEASRDAVASSVDFRVVKDGNLARAGRGDDSPGVHAGDCLAQVVVVTGPVGQHSVSLEAFEQGALAVRLSCRWPAVSRKRSGRPSVSQTMWALVVNPPRERPGA